jgi:hypothetical protein
LRFEGNDSQPAHSFSVRVFNTSGQLVGSHQLTGGSKEYTVDLSSLPHGVYAIQVTTGQVQTTGSTLVRL